MQHKKTVGAVNIMCMARREARRMASGTASTVNESGTTPSAGKVKKPLGRKKKTVDCADEQSQRQRQYKLIVAVVLRMCMQTKLYVILFRLN
jgi:hypothetical protein